MPCYHPLTAYRTQSGQVVFSANPKIVVAELTLPCGQCVGCRLERSRQWAVRCMHEASLHTDNCFITLTYDEANCPVSLDYSHFQKFMKRLRKFYKVPIRFYMCGEYGELEARPHFHACLFGFNFPDRQPLRLLGNSKMFKSESLAKLWPFGFSSIGAVNFESAAYVARYVMKKVTGDLADTHYQTIVMETGEIIQRLPEFCHMSLKPGIGANWIDKFSSDVYPSDEVIVRGRSTRPPRYYDKRFYANDINIDVFEDVAFRRELEARLHVEDSSPERLDVREQVTNARIASLKRNKL